MLQEVLKKISCFFGLHNPLHCFRYTSIGNKDEREVDLDWQGIWAYDTNIIYSNPWSQFAIVETRYRCADCGRKFWYPKGDFDDLKMRKRFIEDLSTIKII